MTVVLEISRKTRRPMALLLAFSLTLGLTACASQDEETQEQAMAAVSANDNLNAVLWTQRSVEFKGNAWTAYKLAMIRLDQALANRKWTGVPAEQTGSYRNLPPAVILDVDETVLDNSDYQAWNVTAGTGFDPKTWTSFVNSQTSRPIPGALEFTQYAAKKGVKVFYVTNRVVEEEAATRENLAKYGFPLDDKMDTILVKGEKEEWKSAKSTRRAHVAANYRVLLNIGDNFSDFTDDFKGTDAERLQVFEANAAHWGKEWIVIANPTYGSFESTPYNNDFKLGNDEKRKAKRDALTSWPGP
ncbi:MAG: 5'-nucleotidase, lipoprotein e(P4) family [Dongiaceae bacterium]